MSERHGGLMPGEHPEEGCDCFNEGLQAEVGRLREEKRLLLEQVSRQALESAEVERLRKVEKAARVFAFHQPGVRLAPEFETTWLDLRAALDSDD